MLFVVDAGAQCPGPAQRTAIINLQRSLEAEGTRAGQIPLTDTCGNQRYAQYVEVNPDTINYIPSDSGNAQNLSEFVRDTTGTLWYIDWQGNAVSFQGGGGSCDVDFLQISDNSCPDALTDSIYKYHYIAVGARYVWPGAELLVNDSSSTGIAVIQGSRNARLALYDSFNGTFTMFDHGGTNPVVYVPVNANLLFKTTGGTPETPVGSQVNHFAINAQDSTIQAHQYPNTRTDPNTVVNFLYTDGVGKFRSRPITYFSDSLGFGVNIYNSSGTTTENRDLTAGTATTFQISHSDNDGKFYLSNDEISIIGTDAENYLFFSDGNTTIESQNTRLVFNSGSPGAITYNLQEENNGFQISDVYDFDYIKLDTTNISIRSSNYNDSIVSQIDFFDDGTTKLYNTNEIYYNCQQHIFYPTIGTYFSLYAGDYDNIGNGSFFIIADSILQMLARFDDVQIGDFISESNGYALSINNDLQSFYLGNNSYADKQIFIQGDADNEDLKMEINADNFNYGAEFYSELASGEPVSLLRAYKQSFDIFSSVQTESSESRVSITSYDASATNTNHSIILDTSGLQLLIPNSGNDGDLLQSDGTFAKWSGGGTFNADMLSYQPSESRYIAVSGNRVTKQVAIGVLTPAESTVEILVDTAATTSTINLNYTPDERYSDDFTTVRYITNWGSGNATVQTNQSWRFKTSAGYANTLTIGTGETYKLLWVSDPTPENCRFYAIRLQ